MDPRLSMQDFREQIARLESEIERLGDSAERCRKIAVGARIAIGAGCALLAAVLLGLLRADGLYLILSGIFGIGGVVLAGSNDTTAKQIAERIAQTEQQRAELIGQMDLTLVPEPSRLLH